MSKKQFTLDSWFKDKSQKVVTRCGFPVRIVCTDVKRKDYPILALVERDDQEEYQSFTKDGRFSLYNPLHDNFDLFIETADEVSEDEKILEIIKHCIESRYLHTSTIKGISQKQCLAWLEKQGQVKESTISQHENKMCEENDNSLTCEDEKVRKEIINYFQCQSEEEPTRKEIHDKWIAWLENVPVTIDHEKREGFHLGYKACHEKRGEQKSITFNNAHLIDSALNDYCCKQYDALYKENGGFLSFARLQHLAMDIYGWCKEYLQGEQKPADIFIGKACDAFCKVRCKGKPPRSTCTSLGTCREYDDFCKTIMEKQV